MKRFSEAILKLIQGLSKAVLRFPLTIFFLVCCTALTCYMVSLHKTPDLIIQKLMFVCLLGSFIGVTAQFACDNRSGGVGFADRPPYRNCKIIPYYFFIGNI